MFEVASFLLFAPMIGVIIHFACAADVGEPWGWFAGGVPIATFFIACGFYPEIFPRGEGFLTANRAAGFGLYMTVFGIAVLSGAWRAAERRSEYYRGRWSEECGRARAN